MEIPQNDGFFNQANRPLSYQGKRPVPASFFGFFVLIGGMLFYCFFIRPMVGVIEARNWVETPCRIVSSKVGYHSGSKGGTTYSVDIVFSYSVGGRRFTAARYDFMGGSSSGYAGKEEIVERYPPGEQTVCYVNPGNPADAVMERGFTPDMLVGLVPLVFVLFGAVALRNARKGRRAGT